MSRKEDITTTHGISILGPEAAVVNSFAQKGVRLHPHTVHRLRADTTSGDRLAMKLDMSEALKRDASKKDKLYYDIAAQGKKVRQVNGQRRYQGKGFTEAIAEELHMESQDVRRSLRAMRADIVLSEACGEIPFLDEFRLTAEQYLYDFTVGWSASRVVKKINQEWKRDSIREFYGTFYRLAETATTLRTFPPYEMDTMESYYKERLESGSRLSELDKLTLSKNATGSRLDSLVDAVRSTGIPYDGVVHYAHTNALLFGQPTRPVDQAS